MIGADVQRLPQMQMCSFCPKPTVAIVGGALGSAYALTPCCAAHARSRLATIVQERRIIERGHKESQ